MLNIESLFHKKRGSPSLFLDKKDSFSEKDATKEECGNGQMEGLDIRARFKLMLYSPSTTVLETERDLRYVSDIYDP
ncbi:unnamed protein product [Moneuplotes crassus]|uniref:Uncharacterized protein n=1 Tax=Euplotes crassus TaxID=5936 RepID=A0AAD2D632_EUPCR|nr:unnamed protein product [Moneuplotes crassus]